jgi:hypothetical protein
VRRRDLFRLGTGAIVGLPFAPPVAEARSFTDSADRRIDVPDDVRRVFPAGPPASVSLYIVAPEKMLGWTRAPGPEARPFLPALYAELPEIGRVTGRGNTVNLESVVRLMPTLMTSAAVAASGIIGWVGLVVPHLARLTVGPAFTRLVAISVLFGARYMRAVDTVTRTVGTVELPLGVLTAALGTPVFLWLLAFGRRKAWS